MASVSASQAYSFNDGDAGKLLTFSAGAPAVNNIDILCVNSDTTVDTPSGDGFVLAESRVANQGAYVFTRKAVGGEAATATVNTNGNHNCSVLWARVVNGTAVDLSEQASADAAAAAVSPAFTSSALAESGEIAIAFLALHGWPGTPPTSYVWGNSFTEVINGSIGAGGSAAGAGGSVAYRTPVGTSAFSASASWTNNATDRYLLVVTITADLGVSVSGALALPLPTASGAATSVAPAAAGGGGGWQSLLDIVRDAQATRDREISTGPVACPIDGEPLSPAPHGGLYCRFDGWRPP